MEFEYFLEYISRAHCILKDMLSLIDEDLSGEIGIGEELSFRGKCLEANFFYLSDFNFRLSSLIQESQSVKFEQENNINCDNVLMFPDKNYDVKSHMV